MQQHLLQRAWQAQLQGAQALMQPLEQQQQQQQQTQIQRTLSWCCRRYPAALSKQAVTALSS
jgi:hypothetical protein